MIWRTLLMAMITLGIASAAHAYNCSKGNTTPGGIAVNSDSEGCLIIETTDRDACRDTDSYAECVAWADNLCETTGTSWRLPNDTELETIFNVYGNFADENLCKEGFSGCSLSPSPTNPSDAPPFYWSNVENKGGAFRTTGFSFLDYMNEASTRCVKRIPIAMIAPYTKLDHIASATGFGFGDDGVDLHAVTNAVPGFQAVAPGTVESVEISRSSISMNWQINVRVRLTESFNAIYAFEPMSQDVADMEKQLAFIQVKVGDVLQQGDFIGFLYNQGNATNPTDPHVHFGFQESDENGSPQSICPEAYFGGTVVADIEGKTSNGMLCP